MTEAQAHTALLALSAGVPGRLLRFAVAMEKADHGPAIDGWGYFLEKSWKWSREFCAWVKHGEPDPGADTFDAFADELEASVND